MAQALDLVHRRALEPDRRTIDGRPCRLDRGADRPSAGDLGCSSARSPIRARAATITSGSNSSATACSAWSSPTGSTSFSRRARRQVVARLNVLVSRDDLRRSRARDRARRQIRLGKQARDDGAYDSDNVLGDVVEALIGALFSTPGFEAARAFIRARLGATGRRGARAPQASQVGAAGMGGGARPQAAGL